MPKKSKSRTIDKEDVLLLLGKGKKGIWRIFFSRTTFIFLMFAIQAVIVFLALYKFSEYLLSFFVVSLLISSFMIVKIVNSPSNPTGSVYSADELKAIMDLVVEKNLLVMSDEIYSYLMYDGCVAASPASVSEEAWQHTIVVSGFSKAYSMTGWRIGYTASDAALAKAIGSMQSHMTSNPNTIAQYAAEQALAHREGEEFLRTMRIHASALSFCRS